MKPLTPFIFLALLGCSQPAETPSPDGFWQNMMCSMPRYQDLQHCRCPNDGIYVAEGDIIVESGAC